MLLSAGCVLVPKALVVAGRTQVVVASADVAMCLGCRSASRREAKLRIHGYWKELADLIQVALPFSVCPFRFSSRLSLQMKSVFTMLSLLASSVHLSCCLHISRQRQNKFSYQADLQDNSKAAKMLADHGQMAAAVARLMRPIDEAIQQGQKPSPTWADKTTLDQLLAYSTSLDSQWAWGQVCQGHVGV